MEKPKRKTPSESSNEGPASYENWKAMIKGVPDKAAHEYPLYTDSHIVGEVLEGLGPYRFLNTISTTKPVAATPSIVLRIEDHLEHDPGSIKMETNTERYHGGWISDELAALVSLCLGMRLKSGFANRHFYKGGDPRGHPYLFYGFHEPVLLKPSSPNAILPRALRQHSLEDTRLIETFPLLSPGQAIALIRAARLYQDALWIAESEPERSWLMLVSAIETAANDWRATEGEPLAELRSSMPKLVRLIETEGSDGLAAKVAEVLSRLVGATRKFIDFILEFMPPPPGVRPPDYATCSWEKADLKKSLGKIYHWRSMALHGGTPFPLPMSEPPRGLGLAFSEKPFGLAMSGKGGVWKVEDTPMLLFTFEYIVQNVLLRWWESMIPKATPQ